MKKPLLLLLLLLLPQVLYGIELAADEITIDPWLPAAPAVEDQAPFAFEWGMGQIQLAYRQGQFVQVLFVFTVVDGRYARVTRDKRL